LANPHEHKSRINLPMRKGTEQNRHVRADQTWTVVDDFPDVVPVTPEELAVVEAFLMAQFFAVMAGESAINAPASSPKDAEPPQTHADIRRLVKRRGSRP
jgi:hypothetical protein